MSPVWAETTNRITQAMLDDETSLDETVKEAIESGRFPLRPPDRQWGGPGDGAQCSICGGRIDADALELELEFDTDNPGTVTGHHVHVSCYSAWERFLKARSPEVPNGLPEIDRAVHGEESEVLSRPDGRGNISRRGDSLPSGPARK
jgi:hypothetical protein